MKRMFFTLVLKLLPLCMFAQVHLLEALRQEQIPDPSGGEVVVARVNFGAAITADDGQIDWLSKNVTGAWSSGNVSVDIGNLYSAPGNPTSGEGARHESIPAYITQSVFDQIFVRQTWYSNADISITVTGLSDGDYRAVAYIARDGTGMQLNDHVINGVTVATGIDPGVDFGGDDIGGAYPYEFQLSGGGGQVVFTAVDSPGNATIFAYELIKLN